MSIPETAARDLNIPQALMRRLGHTDCGIYAEVIAGGEIGVGDTIAAEEPRFTGGRESRTLPRKLPFFCRARRMFAASTLTKTPLLANALFDPR